MTEIWRRIEGYQDKYAVSNLGVVKNRFTGKTRRTVINKVTGYEMVMLFDNGKPVNRYVHRLVLQAFIPNAGVLKEVDHIDRNRANNNLLNLKWTDRSGNTTGSMKYNFYKGKRVAQIDKESGVTVAEWSDYIEAARFLGVRPCRIAYVLDPSDMKHCSVCGYSFKFL